MKTLLIIQILLGIACGFAQQGRILISIDNKHFTGGHPASKLQYDIILNNNTSDTIAYSGGQICIQVPVDILNGGQPQLSLINSDLPDALFKKSVSTHLQDSTLQLRCSEKELSGQVKGKSIVPGGSLKLGTYELRTTSTQGFKGEDVKFTWRITGSSEAPVTRILLAKGKHIEEVSQLCGFQSGSENK